MPTHYEGDEGTRRALDAYIKLSRATKAMWSRLNRNLTEYDLTLSQLGTLEALHFLGPLFQKDLSEKLLVTGGNITMVVNNLEKRGLVTRERNQQDRRQVLVSLTSKGEALIKAVFPQHADQITAMLSVLSPADQDELGRLCKSLGLTASRES